VLPATAATTPKATRATSTVPVGTVPAGSPASAGTHRACAQPTRPGWVACQAIVRGTGVAASTDQGIPDGVGFGPADIQNAYNLPSATAGSGETVAIVDAYDLPTAAADLAAYRTAAGLPPCTADSGCFRKVNEHGDTSYYPTPDPGWGVEIALDMEMVSAACPNCRILLVEADQADTDALGAAENTAVAQGAVAVSNSWGANESYDQIRADAQYFDHPGVAITASSGDGGYGVIWPASSPHVTAVGGTSLTRDATSARGWSETAWAGAGSGCSALEPKPAWQADTGCPARSVADVSAVADPNTGVAVYDSFDTYQPWNELGGTSVASPIIASVYALAGAPRPGTQPNSYPYANPGALNEVTSGGNGNGWSCDPTYECNAGPGYDGPTGLGTPDGVGAFAAPGTQIHR
jgi:subtilase family serine protease